MVIPWEWGFGRRPDLILFLLVAARLLVFTMIAWLWFPRLVTEVGLGIGQVKMPQSLVFLLGSSLFFLNKYFMVCYKLLVQFWKKVDYDEFFQCFHFFNGREELQKHLLHYPHWCHSFLFSCWLCAYLWRSDIHTHTCIHTWIFL